MPRYPYHRRRPYNGRFRGAYGELTPAQKFTVYIPLIILGVIIFFSLPWLVPICMLIVAACSMSPIGWVLLGLILFFIGVICKEIWGITFKQERQIFPQNKKIKT